MQPLLISRYQWMRVGHPHLRKSRSDYNASVLSSAGTQFLVSSRSLIYAPFYVQIGNCASTDLLSYNGRSLM